MKKSFVSIVCLLLLLGFSGITLAFTDNIGEAIAPCNIDLISAEAEIYDRGDTELLKLTIEASPHVPAVIIFEGDVDNSTGTGGTISQLGAPVPPCPCKTTEGFDIAISLYTRSQGESSTGALAASCTDNSGTCGAQRQNGEWYALDVTAGQPLRALGILRGIADPLPKSPESGTTEDCYTFPYGLIKAYTHQNQTKTGTPRRFNFPKSQDATNLKWDVGLFYDPSATTGDEDDVATGDFPDQTFDICDWGPDGDGTKADVRVTLGAADPSDLIYCEGNFDGDKDVDGGDAAKFKANFGRSPFKNPCPACGPNY